MEIVSFAQYGYEGEIVKIEADLRRGIPAIDIAVPYSLDTEENRVLKYLATP